MARLREPESAEADDRASLYRDPSLPPPERDNNARPYLSLSPSPSTTSDKENGVFPRRSKSIMGPPDLPAPTPEAALRNAKRRRLGELDGASSHRTTRERSPPRPAEHQQNEHTSQAVGQDYDPNQPVEERREVRKGMRDLHKELQDSRSEWLAPESRGVEEVIDRADGLFQSVKQTSDATLDSRILVDAGDIIHKKSTGLVAGAGAQGIDVDEFVSKCIAFMRLGDEVGDQGGSASSGTQRLRRRVTQHDSDEEEDEGDDGNGLNWEWLGARACFPTNSRPPVPGFLLGPLSVQKRARTQKARRERLQKAAPTAETRPEELRVADLERNENNNLTTQCQKIYLRLCEVGRQRQESADAEYERIGRDLSEEEMLALADKHHIADNGGVPLFNFVINPDSFGQTVENLFYISFLIRDGYLGIEGDSRGMPALMDKHESDAEEAKKREKSARHQSVFSLDFETWRELIEVFNIRESVIPHREMDEAPVNVGANGWYT